MAKYFKDPVPSLSPVPLEDPRETNGHVFKRINGEEWQITETHYLLNGSPAVPVHFGDIDIDDETNVITYEDLTFGFCPRGYFVSGNGLPEAWCPTARIAIAYSKNKNNVVIETYDERNQ